MTPVPNASQARLERYLSLRTQLKELKAELDGLAPQLRADLEAGLTLTSGPHTALLQHSHTTRLPTPAFVAQFGAQLALQVALIDTAKVKKLVERGELDAALVAEISERTARTPALVIRTLAAGG